MGWWEGESFVISTELNNDDLVVFFCDEYSPSPIVAPWNGGSGFYLGDALDGIEAIEKSAHKRFADYRETISQIKRWPEMPRFERVEDVFLMLRSTQETIRPGKKRDEIVGMLADIEAATPSQEVLEDRNLPNISLSELEDLAITNSQWNTWWKEIKKARTKCNLIKRSENKNVIMPLCRTRLPESSLQWLDAVYALHGDGKASYSPVLGTGGNEKGRFELSNNFMQRVSELFISGEPKKTSDLFRSATFGTVVTGLVKASIGQYDPGRAGGYNQGMGIETKDFKINPWDFILAMEGSIVLAGAVARRNHTDEGSQFTTPFTVLFSSVGFSSNVYEETGRREIWLPLWKNPSSYSEIKYFFGEGRSTVGRRMAKTGIEFSRAVGTLGVDRGIDAFERYAFLERRGQSYVALPAGRISVRYRPELELLNELDIVSRPIWQFIKGFKSVPATFHSALKKRDEAIFTCSQDSGPYNFCGLVRAVGNLERLIAIRDRSKKPILDRPLSGLSPRWIALCDDGGIEVRIAAALASIQATGKIGPLRSNMSEVDPLNPNRWGKGKGDRQWYGNSLPERLAGVLIKRLMDAGRRTAPCVPINGLIPVSPHDIMLFLRGECDDIKLEDMLWGFTLIDWKKMGVKKLRNKWQNPLSETPLSRTWCVLKLLHTPEEIYSPDKKTHVMIKKEPRIAHMLLAERIKEACDVAVHRLSVSDLHPFNITYMEAVDTIRLLASLLIPAKDQWKLESLVLEKQTTNN